MQTGSRIQDHLTSWQLDGVGPAIDIVDYQFPAVVLVRLAQEEGGRQVGANAKRCSHDRPNRVVDMRTQGHADIVAVEERWENG